MAITMAGHNSRSFDLVRFSWWWHSNFLNPTFDSHLDELQECGQQEAFQLHCSADPCIILSPHFMGTSTFRLFAQNLHVKPLPHTYIYIYTYMFIYIYTYIYIYNIYIYTTYIHTYIYIYLYIFTTCIYIYIYMCTFIYYVYLVYIYIMYIYI